MVQAGVEVSTLLPPRFLCALTSRQALRNVHLTSRETAVLRRRFEAAGGGGTMDVPAVLRFFGRDAPQHSVLTDDADQPPGVDTSGQGEAADREKVLQKARRRAEDEESRSASEVEVGRSKNAVNTIALPEVGPRRLFRRSTPLVSSVPRLFPTLQTRTRFAYVAICCSLQPSRLSRITDNPRVLFCRRSAS